MDMFFIFFAFTKFPLLGCPIYKDDFKLLCCYLFVYVASLFCHYNILSSFIFLGIHARIDPVFWAPRWSAEVPWCSCPDCTLCVWLSFFLSHLYSKWQLFAYCLSSLLWVYPIQCLPQSGNTEKCHWHSEGMSTGTPSHSLYSLSLGLWWIHGLWHKPLSCSFSVCSLLW